MSAKTAIQRTDLTWNIIVGCKKVSPGCAGSYAIKDMIRMEGNPNPPSGLRMLASLTVKPMAS